MIIGVATVGVGPVGRSCGSMDADADADANPVDAANPDAAVPDAPVAPPVGPTAAAAGA